MTGNPSEFVFLADCGDLGEAQVLKSFLEAEGFHPRVRDLHTRTVASHLGTALGKLTLEVPDDEFIAASQTLEKRVVPITEAPPAEESHLVWTQGLAKKAMWNAVLGMVIIPLLPNFYSMALGYRVLKTEKPISGTSLNRIFWAIVFNSITFVVWFVYLPHVLRQITSGDFSAFF